MKTDTTLSQTQIDDSKTDIDTCYMIR